MVTVYVPTDKEPVEALTEPSLHKIAYGAVPPPETTAADPSDPPKHVASVADSNPVRSAGSVTMACVTPVQPFASVTVTVYVPAERFIIEGDCAPPGFQSYVYGEVAPCALTVAVPSAPPKQLTGVVRLFTTNGAGSVILKTNVDVQPLTSVTSAV